MAVEQIGKLFTKEEWLDDVEIPCKEEEENKAVTLLNVACEGVAGVGLEDGTICEFPKKEEVEQKQVFKPEDQPLYYSVELNYDSVSLKENTRDCSGKEMPYFCHVCDYVADSSDMLIYHVKSHENEIGDPSENLRSEGDPSESLHSDHAVNATRGSRHKTLACDHCNFTSTTLRDMNNHKKTHLTSLACDNCDFKTTSLKSFVSHRHIHYPKSFACGICSYSTSDRAYLQNHMVNHAKKLCPTKKEGPADPRFLGLKCRQCDYIAANVTDLTDHMESHRAMPCSSDRLPSGLECNQCDFKGETQNSLRSHHNINHKALCQYCQLLCVDKKALKEHMVNFHNAKPSFLVQLLRSSRIASKATRKQIFCALCGYKGACQWHLDNHLKNAHNANIKPQRRIKKSSPSKPLMLTGNGLLD